MRPSPGTAGSKFDSSEAATSGVDGPMARDVLDCALSHAMRGLRRRSGQAAVRIQDALYPGRPEVLQQARTHRPIHPGGSACFAAVTSEIDNVLRAALDSLRLPKVDIVEHCPDLPRLDETFRALRCLSFLGSYQVTPDSVTRHYKDTIKGNLADARAMTFDDYVQAERDRSAIYNTMATFFQTHDVLACPVNGLAPLPVEIEYPTEVADRPMRDYIDWLQFAFLATVAGLPALSLPVGYTPSGMPVGLQLIGPPRGEARLLQVAHTLEQALDLPVTLIDPIAG